MDYCADENEKKYGSALAVACHCRIKRLENKEVDVILIQASRLADDHLCPIGQLQKHSLCLRQCLHSIGSNRRDGVVSDIQFHTFPMTINKTAREIKIARISLLQLIDSLRYHGYIENEKAFIQAFTIEFKQLCETTRSTEKLKVLLTDDETSSSDSKALETKLRHLFSSDSGADTGDPSNDFEFDGGIVSNGEYIVENFGKSLAVICVTNFLLPILSDWKTICRRLEGYCIYEKLVIVIPKTDRHMEELCSDWEPTACVGVEIRQSTGSSSMLFRMHTVEGRERGFHQNILLCVPYTIEILNRLKSDRQELNSYVHSMEILLSQCDSIKGSFIIVSPEDSIEDDHSVRSAILKELCNDGKCNEQESNMTGAEDEWEERLELFDGDSACEMELPKKLIPDNTKSADVVLIIDEKFVTEISDSVQLPNAAAESGKRITSKFKPSIRKWRLPDVCRQLKAQHLISNDAILNGKSYKSVFLQTVSSILLYLKINSNDMFRNIFSLINFDDPENESRKLISSLHSDGVSSNSCNLTSTNKREQTSRKNRNEYFSISDSSPGVSCNCNYNETLSCKVSDMDNDKQCDNCAPCNEVNSCSLPIASSEKCTRTSGMISNGRDRRNNRTTNHAELSSERTKACDNLTSNDSEEEPFVLANDAAFGETSTMSSVNDDSKFTCVEKVNSVLHDEKRSSNANDASSCSKNLSTDEKSATATKPSERQAHGVGCDSKKLESIKNILFKMLESPKLYTSFDFEQCLREAINVYNVDITLMRNNLGMTLLHAITMNDCTTFLLPLFRCGCWNKLRPLTVLHGGDMSAYNGKTAYELCEILGNQKTLKEIDTITAWEKPMNIFHTASRKGNFQEVQRLLELSQDAHVELDSMDCSTLYWAVIGGNIDIVKLLLDKGVDHSKPNSRQETLLHACCMTGQTQLVPILIKELNMDIMAQDIAKKTPLKRVAENGDTRTLAKLIECGVSKDLINAVMPIAGHYGRLNFIKFAIENYGAHPQAKDDVCKSAFLRASDQGHIELLKYLLTKSIDLSEQDSRGRNALHLAADGSDAETMSYLIAEMKVRVGSQLDQLINARDKYVGTELCMMVRGRERTVEEPVGRESFHYIEVLRGLYHIFNKRSRGGTLDISTFGVVLISGWGASPDDSSVEEIDRRFESRRLAAAKGESDVTPLHVAAFRSKTDVMRVLLENGASVNTRDKFGMTALHIAAMTGNMASVQLLIKHGANASLLDSMVKTAADVADDNENTSISHYLRNMAYYPVAENFREKVLSDVLQSLSVDNLVSVQNQGQDLRIHLINTLRGLTVSINESLAQLDSGPVQEESASAKN